MSNLLSLLFSGKDLLTSNRDDYWVELPIELEKLILDYCKPLPFTFQNTRSEQNQFS
jgi:hypothetical protein